MGEKNGQNEYIGLFNGLIVDMFEDVANIVRGNPKLAFFILKTIKNQKSAVRTREKWEKKGTHVPPFMIMSITGRCNFSCPGCYARPWRDRSDEEIDLERTELLFQEATDLGISFILLAGGEPLMRKDILETASKFSKIVFPVFTNGMLIDEDMIEFFAKNRNLFPVISLEGMEGETDLRRGRGTFARLAEVLEKMKGRGIFVGTSLTVTRDNFDTVTSEDFIGWVHKLGCRLFFFVEYTPVDPGTEDLVPTQDQRDGLVSVTHSLKMSFGGIFIAFPGEEDLFGGCLSAGRGFVHINPFGDLEPCPFAPYHDVNLLDVTLEEALRSRFLKEIRANREMLGETRGGCALWTHQDWVRSLLETK